MKQGFFITGTHEDTRISARRSWKESILEKSIVKMFCQGLAACGIPHDVIRARVPCRHCKKFHEEPSEPGIPDIVGWIPARLLVQSTVTCSQGGIMVRMETPLSPYARPFGIEVKRPRGGIESEAQKEHLERLNRDGGIGMFAREWDAVTARFRAEGVKIPEGI